MQCMIEHVTPDPGLCTLCKAWKSDAQAGNLLVAFGLLQTIGLLRKGRHNARKKIHGCRFLSVRPHRSEGARTTRSRPSGSPNWRRMLGFTFWRLFCKLLFMFSQKHRPVQVYGFLIRMWYLCTYNSIWFDLSVVIWRAILWCDTIPSSMIGYDKIWRIIYWYDMIWYDNMIMYALCFFTPLHANVCASRHWCFFKLP